MRVNRAMGRVVRPKRSARRLAAPVAVALLATCALAAVSWGAVSAYRQTVSMPCFAVKELKVTGLRHVRTEDFVRYISDPRGQSVFTVDLERLQKRAAAHPWIKAASVKRELPSAVRVEVSEREPVAVVDSGSGGSGRFVIDEEGFVMARVDGPAWDCLPVIGYRKALGLKPAEAGTEGELKAAVGLLRLVRKDMTETLAGAAVMVGDDGIPYMTLEGTVVKLGRGGYEDKVRRLSELARDIHSRDAHPATIDLRFPGKVVVRSAPA